MKIPPTNCGITFVHKKCCRGGVACIPQGLVVRLACVASAKGSQKRRLCCGVEKGRGRKGNRGGAQTPKG